ncbi:MAG: XRE family transcriptional regulator [Phenylobacterium sp.]|uniref:helix-turn-helix domain-containing protein n=1 Tax=Phenylobacterium sp. TaxID=1871053 RepID=UPI00122065CE|nr:helix-turn-helix transcriptional regulator [Phenylobacterium sp.]TAJ68730.1 MAG: XRE family transcriptional regulator [Phenylobacterium sp.]
MVRVSGVADEEGLLRKVGSAIRALRKSVNISQESLADAAGIDRSHMGKIERVERNVTLLNLVKISRALGAKPSSILSDAGL